MRAFRELPNARRTASTTQARRAAAGRDQLLSAHSRAAVTATTAPTPPPLAVRAGHGAASSLERRRQSPNGGSTWRIEGSGGAGCGLLSSSPSQRAPLPLGIHFPEKPGSPHTSLAQLTPQCHGAPLPDPGPGGRYLPVGLRRKNPVRGDRVAGNACSLLPVSGASGAVVKWRPKLTPLAANPIQFHSPPSALPVRARARPRDPPPLSLPSLARPLLSLPLPLPSSSSSFSPYHHRHRHHHQQQPPSASFSRSFFFPSLLLCPTTPSPVRGPSGTSDRLSPPRSNARSHPPSLALSTPSPSPSRVGSSLSLSRADVTT